MVPNSMKSEANGYHKISVLNVHLKPNLALDLKQGMNMSEHAAIKVNRYELCVTAVTTAQERHQKRVTPGPCVAKTIVEWEWGGWTYI